MIRRRENHQGIIKILNAAATLTIILIINFFITTMLSNVRSRPGRNAGAKHL